MTIPGSYRTYEEWKLRRSQKWCWIHFQFLPYLWGMETEEFLLHVEEFFFLFLPYLWGMETRCGVAYAEGPYLCSYRTYEEWKHSPNQTFALCVFQVLTVPMRNGNRYNGEYIIFRRTGSYRTYEEWKLHKRILAYVREFGSYRTYEEWKPQLPSRDSVTIWCSYRTYEEWKPQWRIWVGFCGSIVLTVPMRNGNLVGTNHVFPWLIVLTVPMRNGNHGIPSVLTIRTGSYRTYEEWKHWNPMKW